MDAWRVRIADSLADVAADQWNALDLQGNPTLRHEFLLALEQTQCATALTGWKAQHVILSDASNVLGALPLYLKPHSWGEFVFDFSWADAYGRAGLAYYPKLLSTVPFTPASGTRLIAAPGTPAEQRAIRIALLDAAMTLVREQKLSSLHVLFTTADEQALLAERDFITRTDCQFHWRNQGFANFDEFIATFRADKRKKALRERRRVIEAGIRFITLHGDALSDDQWSIAMRLSQATFHAHGHEHYLNVEFFRRVSRTLPAALVVKFALLNDDYVAAAIFYRGANTLYGRYWGAAENFHSLHFEACYYQGIDYCIEHGIGAFEPGTQGEHKIARGFAPARTTSAHYIADPRFARAIAAHAAQEREAVERYIDAVNEHLPFHRAEHA